MKTMTMAAINVLKRNGFYVNECGNSVTAFKETEEGLSKVKIIPRMNSIIVNGKVCDLDLWLRKLQWANR